MPYYQIDDYQFGKITIDGVTYSKDLIILPSRICTGWWREEGHLLQLADLDEVLGSKPELLLIGQGAYSRMRVASDAENALQAAGIDWIALPTDAACQEFNRRAAEQVVAAALHLTC